MELWCKFLVLFVIILQITALPSLSLMGLNFKDLGVLPKQSMQNVSDPLKLRDFSELAETLTLDLLAAKTKNPYNFVPMGMQGNTIDMNNDQYEEQTYSLRRPLCPNSVLNFKGRDDVRFVLYNKNFPLGADISSSLGQGMLMPNTPIKFVIHGFLNGGNSEMVQTVKNAYMSRPENVNVIVVDWSKGSGTWLSNYYICLITSKVVPKVGEAVASFIKDLIKYQNVNILYVNLIGHSLGAQISGIAGHHLKTDRLTLPIIVGLDPALPEFKHVSESERLSPDDAMYVEIIHTNCGELGFDIPIGHADFYPNFANKLLYRMPGCKTASCSHAMSFKYFADSVTRPYSFLGRKCETYANLEAETCDGSRGDLAYMGGFDMRYGKKPGIYYLQTFKDAPYGQAIETTTTV